MSLYDSFVKDLAKIEKSYKDKWFAIASHGLKSVPFKSKVDFLKFISFAQLDDFSFGVWFEVYDFDQGLESIENKFIRLENLGNIGAVNDQDVQDRIIKTAKRKLTE